MEPNWILTSVVHVELDAEVSVVFSAGIVRRRQDDAAVGLALPDDARHGRSRHDAALADDQPSHLSTKSSKSFMRTASDDSFSKTII